MSPAVTDEGTAFDGKCTFYKGKCPILSEYLLARRHGDEGSWGLEVWRQQLMKESKKATLKPGQAVSLIGPLAGPVSGEEK